MIAILRDIDLLSFLYIIPAILISLTVHEFSHGFASYLLGDTRAKNDGRLSLNPLKHLDPIGFICLLLMGFGWAKPVMVEGHNFKDPKNDMAITAFAGPLSNLLLAFIGLLAAYPLSSLYSGDSAIYWGFFSFLITLIQINIILAVFNMLPLPPLDGSKVFGVALPENLYFKMMSADRVGFIILIILLWTNAFGAILFPIRDALFNAMLFVVERIYFFL